ncbi:MAG: DNA/RNA non-specific endonuclease [Clostridia bacterium]|nr:DNA/RNA non-specific endonuclease [Clostridia bacterium]
MKKRAVIGLVLTLVLFAASLFVKLFPPKENTPAPTPSAPQTSFATLSDLPAYNKSPYVTLSDGANFSQELLTTDSFETYAPLDKLGRCGTAFACVGRDLMPTEERGSIGQVKPSGWKTAKYDVVDGKYLYNRCHLIGFQLTGENANEKNLITGTRYFNVDGMLPFENMVADYVKETDNHVLYRVTPIFEGDELVARGVVIEAYSVEDHGEGVDFAVFCYNVQPGIVIDYATGESRLDESADSSDDGERRSYVLNTSSKKFHLPSCSGATSISEENRKEETGEREELIRRGYTPCGSCNP